MLRATSVVWDTRLIVSLVLMFGTCELYAVQPVVRPRALCAGDRIMVVAPAGPPDETAIRLACERLTLLGFEVTLPPQLFRKNDYLAGSDQERADEFMAAVRDPNVQGIFAAKGGFGCTRILDQLDYDVIRQHPKVITGFSDITALHLAIQRRAGLVTFHSPNVDSGWGDEAGVSEFSARWFWHALLDAKRAPPSLLHYTAGPYRITTGSTALSASTASPSVIADPGSDDRRAIGRLTGGNLSLIHALMGTPFEIETQGCILFLEDIGEAPYRVDRMLSTLKLAGKFSDVRGVVLGQFTRRSEENTSGEVRSIRDVLHDYLDRLGVPVLWDFPAGHVRDQATLPLGVRVEVNETRGWLRVVDPPTE